MKHTVRVFTQKRKDGKVEIVTLDARTGRVASRHVAGNLEADLKKKREAYEKAGNRVDVVEG